MADTEKKPVLPRGRKRRRTGGDTPIDFTSFPDASLRIYIDNLAYHVKRGTSGVMLQQYEAAFTEATSRGLGIERVQRPFGAK